MKNTLSTLEAVNELGTFDAFRNWTRNAVSTLVEYIEEIEEDTGTEIEFDPIALRSDFTYHTSAKDLLGDYLQLATVEKMSEGEAFEELAERTTILPVYESTSSMQSPDGYVMQMF